MHFAPWQVASTSFDCFCTEYFWIFWLLNLRLPTMGIPVRLGLVPGIASFVQDIIALLTRYLWIPGFSNSTSMNLLEDHGLWYLQFPYNFWLAARPEVAWRFKPVRSASAFVGQRHPPFLLLCCPLNLTKAFGKSKVELWNVESTWISFGRKTQLWTSWEVCEWATWSAWSECHRGALPVRCSFKRTNITLSMKDSDMKPL